MHITLHNLDTVAVPFSSPDNKGFATMLEPGTPTTIDSPDVTVGSVGDNPTFREEFAQAFEQLLALLTFWRERKGTEDPRIVHVAIENHGPNALRVLLGSNTKERQVIAGETYTATADEYVEIRELGV
jgi:hypothetical protein